MDGSFAVVCKMGLFGLVKLLMAADLRPAGLASTAIHPCVSIIIKSVETRKMLLLFEDDDFVLFLVIVQFVLLLLMGVVVGGATG